MKTGKGAILHDDKTSEITGSLIIGSVHYEIKGHRVNAIRTHLYVRQTSTDEPTQGDLFEDERSGDAGARKRDLV